MNRIRIFVTIAAVVIFTGAMSGFSLAADSPQAATSDDPVKISITGSVTTGTPEAPVDAAAETTDKVIDKDAELGEVRIYTTANGLPTDEIVSVSAMEDLPYVGSTAGVSDFDGDAWRTYPEKHGFPTDTVSFILVMDNFGVMGVKDGFSLYLEGVIVEKKVGARGTAATGAGNSFYLGTEKGLYSRKWDLLKSTELAPVEGLSDASISALSYDGQKGIWIAAGETLYHMDEDAAPEKRQGPDAGKINSLYLDGNGALWAGTEKGLFRLPAGSDSWGEVRCGAETCGNVTSLSGSGKHFWIGTTNGAFRMGGGVRVFRGGTYMLDNKVNCLAATLDGGAWLATPKGLSRIVPID